MEAAGSADDEPEEGEIVDSGGDEDDPAVCTKISPLNRSTDDAKGRDGYNMVEWIKHSRNGYNMVGMDTTW